MKETVAHGQLPHCQLRVRSAPYSVRDIQERLSHRQVNDAHLYNARDEPLDHLFVRQRLVEQNPAHIAQVRSTWTTIAWSTRA